MEWENGILSTAFELELVTRTSIKYLTTKKEKINAHDNCKKPQGGGDSLKFRVKSEEVRVGRATRRLVASIAIITALFATSSAWAADWTVDVDTTLTEDKTVDALTVNSDVTLDLAGFNLTCSSLAGAGTITNTGGSSDLTSPSGTVTWSTQAGNATGTLNDATSGANLFNNNFVSSSIHNDHNSNDKRVLVPKANLPLVVTYDFGEGKAEKVNKYMMYFYRTDDCNGRGPKKWTFEGSNDNDTWTSLDSRSGVTWTKNNQPKSYTFTNTTAYRYYRITFKESNDSSYFEFQQLEYFNTNPAELHVDVADGNTAEVGSLTLSGNMKVVKEGAGELAMAKDERYTGGTVLSEGTLALTGTVSSFDLSKFTFGTSASKPVTLRVGEGATVSSSSSFLIEKGTVEVNGGTVELANDLVVGQNGTGTLTIKGGTVMVPSRCWTIVGKYSGSSGTINLNGGCLTTKYVYKESGSATINFNGGTLKANGVDATNGLINSNATVNVDAGGGTIDCGNQNIFVKAVLAGTGGMTFAGGGKATLTGENTYEGTTTIEVGTAVVVASTSYIGSGLALTLPVEAPADGVYTVLSVSGDETLKGFTLPDAPEKCSLRLSSDNKSILCIYGNSPNTWTGGASGSLSDDTNWSLRVVPTHGDSCIIKNSGEAASLMVGDTFAPSAITFAADSAAVTIGDDNDLNGIVAVTNLSSVSHTINAKVYFAGDIQVSQAAMTEKGDLSKAHVTFAGGAYAATGCALESGSSDAVYSRCIFGKYYLANTSSSRWTARY